MSYWNDDDLITDFCTVIENDECLSQYRNNLGKQGLGPYQEIQQYLDVLFDDDDILCICNNPKDYKFITKKSYQKEIGKLIAFNPFKIDSTTRKRSDLSKMRSFLIEFDDISIKQQFDGIEKINLPSSLVTFSGNKSLHIIITLCDPIVGLQEYSHLATWVHNILEKYVSAPDPLTKVPNFLTRFPNVTADNGFSSQKLIKVGSRIENNDLYRFFEKHKELEPKSWMPPNSHSIDPRRKNIIKLIDWFVLEHLSQIYQDETSWFQCPLCLEEGKHHYGKRLCINGVNRYIKCFADKKHNEQLIQKIWDLKRGENNGK